MQKYFRYIIFMIFFSCLGYSYSYAYNIRQISNKDGLSNSAVLSLHQDSEGLMWFGTCDGLNIFDGISIKTYKPNKQDKNNLSGNLIESIHEAEDGTLWINTNYGLNKLNKKNGTVEQHNHIIGDYRLAVNKDKETFIVRDNNKCFYYQKKTHSFQKLPLDGIKYKNVIDFFIDNNNTMWIFTSDGVLLNAQINFKNETDLPSISSLKKLAHPRTISYAFHEDNTILFTDSTQALYEYNTITKKLVYIENLTKEITDNGRISSIIKDGENYFIAFLSNGLIHLQSTPDQQTKYRVETIDIMCGIFSLVKDKNQDIVWVGTDGQGVYMYSRNSFSLRTYTYDFLPFNLSKPTRSIFVDKNNTLWLGTKDDGILRFPNFTMDGDPKKKKVERYTKQTTSLVNNSIYAFAASRRNIIWIGSDGPGINYYSYKDDKIHAINSENNSIKYVHSLRETNDTTLWIATVAAGIIKATISGTRDNIKITNMRHIQIDKSQVIADHYFSMYQENDSILWLGSRGYGIVRLNTINENYEVIKFDKNNVQTINDIFAIHKGQNNNLWLGTSFGLTNLYSHNSEKIEFKNYNENVGLPNNTIHGILEDFQHNLWLSTNSGIIEFNPKTESFVRHNQHSGLDILEFSDGAYFKDPKTGIMYFGGTNGFAAIKEDIFTKNPYNPAIIFRDIRIYEKMYNINDFLNSDNELELNYNQDFVNLSFVAIDYINGINYSYEYKLENLKDYWINNGNSNNVTFTNLSPGTYTLLVRYKGGSSDVFSKTYSIKIKILPPWYLTTWAYFLYYALMAVLAYYIFRLIKKRQENRHNMFVKQVENDKKEEVYESKLRFFINITHELSTPLTLIYGPCQHILTYERSDSYIKKHTHLIYRNAERLNNLIQNLIEFRRLDTENKRYHIKLAPISELSKDITESFIGMSESNKIEYNLSIQDSVLWTTDEDAFTTILTNLISNAFKYTPESGKISVSVSIPDKQCLQIIVSNTGKGIKPHDLNLIFDRYQILDNLEKQSVKGASRNGLGLAICHSTVKLLEGNIIVKSTPNLITEFCVTLPQLPLSLSEEENTEGNDLMFVVDEKIEPINDEINKSDYALEMPEYTFDKSKPSIMVIDDDQEMLWFIANIFTEKYNVISVAESTKAMEILQQTHFDLIISDIMMPEVDGITLTKMIKQTKHTAHITVILLSARQYIEEQIKGVESGADVYLTKPFNVEYLKTVVDQSIRRKADLKDYFNSSLSSFELTNGKLLHKEEKDFLDKMTQIINENITNTKLSTEFVASEMGLSIRNLYRRLNGLIDKTPADIIKEYRLNIAEHLLTKTNLSIDEIIYKSGFVNRSTFFKLFLAKFDCTPKNYREQKKVSL